MNFIDYGSFPVVSNANHSPTTETFSSEMTIGLPCTTASFMSGASVPLAPFDTQFDSSMTLKPIDRLSSITSVAPTDGTRSASVHDMLSYNHLDTFLSGFAINSTTHAASDSGVSPLSNQSRTPSLCGDVPLDDSTLVSPPHSPHSSLRPESKDSAIKPEDCSLNPPRRKRGRPRLDRSTTSLSTSSSSVQSQRTQRLPHNQVERKYREGLNASLERLRKTIPAFCEDNDLGGLLSTPRPSKAMILEGAIEYIKAIEKERDEYRGEIGRLRRSVGGGWDANGNPSFLAEL